MLTCLRQEFNARTANYNPGTPIPALVTVRPDRSFSFTLRTPPTSSLLLAAAGVSPVKNKMRGAGSTAGPKRLVALAAQTLAAAGSSNKGVLEKTDEAVAKVKEQTKSKAGSKDMAGNATVGTVGTVSLKHVYEIAKIKHGETRLSGLSLEGVAKSVVAQAGSMGVLVVP